MTETPMQLPCQVRRQTENPCTNRAVVEIQGISFCEACAREQEAYFAIGELTQEEPQGRRSKQLAEALERMRRERVGGSDGVATEMHRELSSVNEIARLAPAKG